MLSASWQRRYPSTIPPRKLNFLLPLTPLILISAASCSKNLGTIGDHWRPHGFFSRKLTDTESYYSTFDLKLLAAHAAIRHFRHFCEGHTFQSWTDHQLFVTALSPVSAPISLRQQCHLAFISEFNVQMLCLPDLKNFVADF